MRVADVGVYLHEEVCTYDHWFSLRVIDICRNDCPSGCHLLAHELGCDMCLNAQFAAVHVFSNSDIFHFLGNDSTLSQSHLRLAFLAFRDPRLAQFWKTFFEVNFNVRVAIRATGVVDIHW